MLRLAVRPSRGDADIFAYLEELTASGDVLYRTEGMLRLSRAVAATPPYDNLGMPWFDQDEAATRHVAAGQAQTVTFDLLPFMARFGKGSRIRLTLRSADRDNFAAAEARPFSVLWGGEHETWIELYLDA